MDWCCTYSQSICIIVRISLLKSRKRLHTLGVILRTGDKIIPGDRSNCYGVGARSSGWSMEDALSKVTRKGCAEI